MFCEAYNQSLTDAAAAGELSPGLEQHLASCDSCRAAFSEEQNFFAAIDSGLRVAANSEVSSTLIPRVHVAFNNEAVPQSNLSKWTLAGAVLAGALVAIIGLSFKHNEVPASNSAKSTPLVSPKASETVAMNPPVVVVPLNVPSSQGHRLVEATSSKVSTTEVLVPDEERAAFEKFLGHSSLTYAGLPKAAPAPFAPEAVVQIPRVEIASLSLKPLEGTEGRQGE